MTNRKLLSGLFSLLLLLGVSFVDAIPENQIVTLEMPYAMSANGEGDDTTVVGYEGSWVQAYYWNEDDGLVSLGTGDAEGISENGYIVGTKLINDNGVNRATAGYWDLDGNFTEIGGLPGAVANSEGFYSDGFAISSDGSVIAGMGWTGGWTTNAIKWTEETGLVNLRPGDESSKVSGLSGDGSIAVGWIESNNVRYAAYWDSENVQHSIPGLTDSEAMAICENGEYIIGSAIGSGFIYDGQELNYINANEDGTVSVLNHVTNSGLVVGLERNFMQYFQNGIVYNETMGVVSADDYFTQNGVVLPEDFHVEALSWVSEDGKTFIGWAGFPSQGFIVRLSDSATISGSVTAENGGDVTLASITNGFETVNPDSEGNYSIVVSAGTHTLNVTMPGYYSDESEEIVIEAGETITGVDFSLQEISNSATIQGNITLVGGSSNVTQATIQAGEFLTHPDSDGNYQLYVPAGDYTLSVTLTVYFAYENDLTLENNENIEVDINLYSTSTLYTLIVNVDGQDIDYENTIIFVNHNSPGSRYFYPNENGTLNLGLFYEENLTISVYSPGFIAARVNGVSINPAEDTIVDFSLEKVYNSPRNLSYNDSGILEWEVPYAISSYVDDFESYSENSAISLSNPMWLAIDGDVGSSSDLFIAMDTDISDGKYLEVNSVSDAIVNVGNVMNVDDNLTSGSYDVDFDIKIPNGYAGHYNFIRSLMNLEFSLEVYFRADGTLQIHHSGDVFVNTTFNHDEWIKVRHTVDLTNDFATMTVNGEEIAEWEFSANAYDEGYGQNQFDLINFSGDSEPTAQESGLFYIDNFAFSDTEATSADEYSVYRDEMLLTSTPTSELSFMDEDLANGSYTYGVTALYDEVESAPASLEVEITTTDNEDNDVILATSLKENYPNPFNPETTISFSIAQNEFVAVKIYNIKGQNVKTLLRENLTKGNHKVVWNGLDNKGNQVNSGIYFYRLEAGDFTTTKKMTLIK
jgi:hypothetical protein